MRWWGGHRRTCPLPNWRKGPCHAHTCSLWGSWTPQQLTGRSDRGLRALEQCDERTGGGAEVFVELCGSRVQEWTAGVHPAHKFPASPHTKTYFLLSIWPGRNLNLSRPQDWMLTSATAKPRDNYTAWNHCQQTMQWQSLRAILVTCHINGWSWGFFLR